jgi:aromatic ring-cleaving dioxygenase
MRTGPDGQAASKKLAEAAAKANVPWIMPNEYGPDVFTHPDMGNVRLKVILVSA